MYFSYMVFNEFVIKNKPIIIVMNYVKGNVSQK